MATHSPIVGHLEVTFEPLGEALEVSWRPPKHNKKTSADLRFMLVSLSFVFRPSSSENAAHGDTFCQNWPYWGHFGASWGSLGGLLEATETQDTSADLRFQLIPLSFVLLPFSFGNTTHSDTWGHRGVILEPLGEALDVSWRPRNHQIPVWICVVLWFVCRLFLFLSLPKIQPMASESAKHGQPHTHTHIHTHTHTHTRLKSPIVVLDVFWGSVVFGWEVRVHAKAENIAHGNEIGVPTGCLSLVIVWKTLPRPTNPLCQAHRCPPPHCGTTKYFTTMLFCLRGILCQQP